MNLLLLVCGKVHQLQTNDTRLITLDIIDNMLIVSPPKNEEEDELQDRVGNDDSHDNILDVDYLAYDGLDIDLP